MVRLHSRSYSYQSLNVGSAQPPHTQGKVQSAVSFALLGKYLLQASALMGFIDCQTTSNSPVASILPIMTGLDKWWLVFITSSKPLGALTLW